MQNKVQLLPDSVANQIAAGEVVQRPASVVKELVENAIDAGAKSVTLIIKDAGRTLIQVVDNGAGMSEVDARLAFERHATSKVRSAQDLFALQTFGFRGEALPSIAAVAEVELKTRTADEEIGTRIVINGGTLDKQERISNPIGTSIAVRNLFYNVPVRRKFLKADTTEARHIEQEFKRVAL
ncbi:MAG: DNA mismatch repair endonuclease MutL, partial [Bacteroidales bacterium]